MKREIFLLFTLFSGIAGCNEKAKPRFVLEEVIKVQGFCSEDHVRRSDAYAGEIVRWRSLQDSKISTYGSVTNMKDIGERVADEVAHPTAYHTPFIISFDEIKIDTNQAQWVLHGVSEGSDESSPRYDSTCNLSVVKRGKEFSSTAKPN